MKEGRSRDAVYSLKKMEWVRRDDMKIPRNIFIYTFNQSFIVLIFVLIVYSNNQNVECVCLCSLFIKKCSMEFCGLGFPIIN